MTDENGVLECLPETQRWDFIACVIYGQTYESRALDRDVAMMTVADNIYQARKTLKSLTTDPRDSAE